MPADRPTPEEMLARAAEEQARHGRGKLKVFFGAAPGVGKTFAMLEDGIRERAAGTDVVIGWVETHGRVETERLTAGFERLPPRELTYHGIRLTEFDLDAALNRRPRLILVDELAHTNAEGLRHSRRWQDVEELLDAGIDVYSTLNVQHLESLNDVVAQITGVRVRETVPDAVIERAASIALVDLPPDELIARLEAGKVYVPEQAGRALESFFRRGNLIALRELALRETADRVDAEALRWRRDEGITATWPVGDRLLVAVGPAPQAADVVRAASRIAGKLHAPWIAASVELPNASEAARTSIAGHLAFAEKLGAEPVVLRSDRPVDALLALAHKRNVTRIIVGRPTHSRVRDLFFGSFIDALTRGAGDIDVLVTAGDAGSRERRTPTLDWPASGKLFEAVALVGAATVLSLATRPLLTLPDQAMIHLLAVVVAATRVDRVSSVVAAGLAVASFDFFFVPPFFTFNVSDARYVLTFAVMFAVGVVVSTLTLRVRAQADAARDRERRTAALYAMTRELSAGASGDAISAIAVRHVRELLEVEAVVIRLRTNGIELLAGAALDPRDVAVARWVVAHGEAAGLGTDTLQGGTYRFLPLVGGQSVIGALGLAFGGRPVGASQEELVRVVTANIAVALERAWLAEASETARVVLETERTRTNLLSSMSHDLRTPLASITGAATAALSAAHLTDAARRGLLETIRDEGTRLGELISGLQQLTLLEAEPTAKEWVPIDEVIASAVDRLRRADPGVEVSISVPDEVLLVPMDPVLIDQLLFNFLDNARKYARETLIEIHAERRRDEAVVTVSDRGPGVPTGAEDRVFERFWRSPDGGRAEGHGLGLAIAQAIARVHGGRAFCCNREGGGAVFGFALPVVGDPPATEEVSDA